MSTLSKPERQSVLANWLLDHGPDKWLSTRHRDSGAFQMIARELGVCHTTLREDLYTLSRAGAVKAEIQWGGTSYFWYFRLNCEPQLQEVE